MKAIIIISIIFSAFIVSACGTKRETINKQNGVTHKETPRAPLLADLASKYPQAVQQVSAKLKELGEEPSEFHATVEERNNGAVLVFNLTHKDTYLRQDAAALQNLIISGNPSGKDGQIIYDTNTGAISPMYLWQ